MLINGGQIKGKKGEGATLDVTQIKLLIKLLT